MIMFFLRSMRQMKPWALRISISRIAISRSEIRRIDPPAQSAKSVRRPSWDEVVRCRAPCVGGT
jgi:hypothetical protein